MLFANFVFFLAVFHRVCVESVTHVHVCATMPTCELLDSVTLVLGNSDEMVCCIYKRVTFSF